MKMDEYAGFTLLLCLSCIILLMLFIKWRLDWHHFYKLAKKIPSNNVLPSFPLIGVALNFIGDNEKHLKTLRRLTEKLSPPTSLWFGNKFYVIINRAADMEITLNSTKCLSKDDVYDFVNKEIGEGLLSAPVPVWRKHRKVIMPTLNRRILNNFFYIFYEQSEILAKELSSKCNQLVDVFVYIHKYTLDTVFETSMGVPINSQTQNSDVYVAMFKGMDLVMVRLFNFFYHFDWIFKWTSLSREVNICKSILHTFIMTIIEKKLAAYRKQVAMDKDTVQLDEGKKHQVFLDQLIELSEKGENWTSEEIKSEALIYTIAATDTTASIASFVLLILGIYPEIQQKCYEESMAIIEPERNLDCADLPKLVYLEKVIKETMRVFPVAPFLVRKVDKDVEIGGYTIPKCSGLLLSVIALHYSEQHYKDPLKFDPERFAPEEIAKRHKYSYLPFSAGPRNCIGGSYAMMSMKTMITVILRKYQIETIYKDFRDIRIKQAIVIKAIEGFPIRLIPRN